MRFVKNFLSTLDRNLPRWSISTRPPHHPHEHKNSVDGLFDMFKDHQTGLIPMPKFLASVQRSGIRLNDPRIRGMMRKLHENAKPKPNEAVSPELQSIDLETFRTIISPNTSLLERAIRQQLIIPDFQVFTKDIEKIFANCKKNKKGTLASYIPQLARYNPNYWAVSICTIDGQRFSIGDVKVPFTLQSCSKPLTYAIALEKLGAETVHKHVGQEPSGRMYNELVLDYNKKPHNPMVNAGAIVVCSLLKNLVNPKMPLAEVFDYTQQWFKRMAGGRHIGFNNAVFLSEREAADRNYALGFYMREHNCFPKKTNLIDVMDFYFQCCSLEANSDAVSIMAATLANGGICPLTEEKIFRPAVVRDVLSLMHSCGMYDYSGQFAFKVGLPAKSGVCGGMLVVIPNLMGICTWSPPLDQLGNSCRGVQFCEELISYFNFHLYDNLQHVSDKKDPRRHRYDTKHLSMLNLLLGAPRDNNVSFLDRTNNLSVRDLALLEHDEKTALHLAVPDGHLECLKFLPEQCNITSVDEPVIFSDDSVINYDHKIKENFNKTEVLQTEVEKSSKNKLTGKNGADKDFVTLENPHSKDKPEV